MAAVTPNNPDQVSAVTSTYTGLLHRKYAYTSISSGDTWTRDTDCIINFAWQPTASGDDVTIQKQAASLLFIVPGTGNGTLHIWSTK